MPVGVRVPPSALTDEARTARACAPSGPRRIRRKGVRGSAPRGLPQPWPKRRGRHVLRQRRRPEMRTQRTVRIGAVAHDHLAGLLEERRRRLRAMPSEAEQYAAEAGRGAVAGLAIEQRVAVRTESRGELLLGDG